MTKEQKNEVVSIYGKIKLSNSIDYVGAWYFKASIIIKDTNIKCAFVSTNSITQGEQVAALWKPLYEKFGIHINFAWRTFKWMSEASEQAAVHVVIIGFSSQHLTHKEILDTDTCYSVTNINPYLIDAPSVFIEHRSKPISKVPKMTKGSQPSDGGNLIFNEDEKENAIKKEPFIKKYLYPYIGAKEFINKLPMRYCLWLVNAEPHDLKKSNIIKERLLAVKEMREKSTAAPTRAKASVPHLFFCITQPNTNYVIVPRHSSENRKYIPMGFVAPEIIASDSCSIIPNATLFHFGVLTSNVHMEWMRTVAGRLKSDYRYSGGVVYNNFPWPAPTDKQKAKIEKTSQSIIDARALYPNSSLADLYDDLTMPPELRKAHQANDKAVMEAYGFIKTVDGKATWYSPSECVAALMKMYQELVEGNNT